MSDDISPWEERTSQRDMCGPPHSGGRHTSAAKRRGVTGAPRGPRRDGGARPPGWGAGGTCGFSRRREAAGRGEGGEVERRRSERRRGEAGRRRRRPATMSAAAATVALPAASGALAPEASEAPEAPQALSVAGGLMLVLGSE